MIDPSSTLAAMPLNTGVEAVYAGVDWISCSYPADRGGRWLWADECRRVVEQIGAEGYELEARVYQGYRGLGCAGNFFGSREDSSYLQLSGHHADRFFDTIYRADCHISRLDVQATIRYHVMEETLGYQLYQSAIGANGTLPKSRRRRLWYISGEDGGFTAYIGSASSPQRGRIYNKEVQSEETAYLRCWRWEAVFKNEYATAWAERVADHQSDRARFCASIVVVWFEGRGMRAAWWSDDMPTPENLIKTRPSDADTRLKWLREQVSPAFHWLVANGYEREAYDALGLDYT